jgi:hypothetical protein
MTKDGNKSDVLGDAHPTLWEAKLSKTDKRRIRGKCYISKFIKIRFDEEKLGAVVCSDYHEVYLYKTMFRAGFRLPFLLVIRELLHYLDLAPHQIMPNTWRVLYGCMVLLPLALGKEHQLTVKEFLHLYRVHKNPGGSGVYKFQTRRGRLIQLELRYSSNQGWKNKFFFASGQWKFAPSEQAGAYRVFRETNVLSQRGNQEPILTPSELARVNKVLKWVQRHDTCTFYGVLVSVPRPIEFVYGPAAHVAFKMREEALRDLVNLGPLTANTWDATPRKDQARAAIRASPR